MKKSRIDDAQMLDFTDVCLAYVEKTVLWPVPHLDGDAEVIYSVIC